MFKSKLSKVIVSLLRRVLGVTRSGAKRLMRAMLRSLMAMGRRARLPVAGFVLPTVTMVLLVVILLTVAITLRSFDRGNMARNVRVNQQVLAAATPALDRAKAKIEYLLGEAPVTGTPSDQQLYLAMSSYPATPDPNKPDLYSFGDEERLKLKANLDPDVTLDLKVTDPGFDLEKNESINTAWRYPVDTNKDGKFDTYTLYGIFFRSPPRIKTGSNAGDFMRERKPLEARTPPMSLGVLKEGCEAAAGNSASLVGESGWYRIDGKLKKSFFVYTVNVPITATEASSLDPTKYQAFTGTTSISALEYQQDQSLIPLSNNAVVYEDDLDISPGPPLNLNGRVFTNSNLLVSGLEADRSIKLFQVSSKKSCFYDQENSKIVVGGNVVNGWAGNTTDAQIHPVEVHLFKKTGDPEPNASAPAIETATQSVKEKSLQVLYNSDAYSKRLDALVQGQMDADTAGATDPVSVKRAQLSPTNLQRKDALESYFKDRLRKVTFTEAPLGSDAGVSGGSGLEGSGDTLRPKDDWSLPTGTATVGAVGGSTGLTLQPNLPPANNPANVQPTDSEPELGNRVAIGNNLPALRWDGSKFLGSKDTQEVDGTATWKGDTVKRTRTPQVTKLADVGATDRGNGLGEEYNPANPFKDGFWEASAAQIPKTAVEGVGGLRAITSAGVYDRINSFLPPPKWRDRGGNLVTAPATYDDPATDDVEEKYPVVWPDSMPMSPLGPGSKVYDNVAGAWDDWPGGAADGTGLNPAVASIIGIVEEGSTARKYAKGDLRMRATAVYHYEKSGYDPLAGTQPKQEPYACVSSYYDPSNASTARNIKTGNLTLDSFDVSGEKLVGSPRQAFIGSNNGVTYPFPTEATRPGRSTIGANGLLTGGDPVFATQANLVFPDGRFANGRLRSALQVPEDSRTLAQQAAIDSTICALTILAGGTPDATLIPHGAIQEVAFLNGREVKAVDRDDPDTIVNEAFTLSSPLTTMGTALPAKLTGNYNQSVEERLPLEIRATQLDIDRLRRNRPKGSTTEWLLPNSGIIYATRDDALPDRSNREANPDSNKRKSPTDNLLDPTRKPNGIVLINGQKLFRGDSDTPAAVTSVNDIVREKGLILVSNLPVYIKGFFNLHGNIPTPPPGGSPTLVKVEEFTDDLTQPSWGNFYNRATLNDNFACRQGDPRLPKCKNGDFWRPATVLADAVTLISQQYRFGFRNEGDFDLRNNAGAAAVLPRRQQGFFNNNFVTNGLSSGAFLATGNLKAPADPIDVTDADYASTTTSPPITSSYFNNFVTPVQRRGTFPEYVMETCIKLPVSECTEADWFVDPLATYTPRTATTAGSPYVQPNPDLGTPSFQAGSTVDPPLPELQRFPRRVAFNRGSTTFLTAPEPLGIKANKTIVTGVGDPRGSNALWFAAKSSTTGNVVYNDTDVPYAFNTSAITPGISDGSRVPIPTLATASTTLAAAVTPPTTNYTYSGSQPLLVPVMQLMGVAEVTGSSPYNPRGNIQVNTTGWIPKAVETTFNLIVGAGDTPSRALDPASGDFNGGLQNLPRFLELWGGISNNIQGSFIQQNRSAFSTAPYQPILPTGFPTTTADKLATLFSASADPSTAPTPLTDSQALITYNTTIGSAKIPYFTPPTRNWGYDVGLLSQPPDLFTQKFTTPPKTKPTEYFREVPGNDDWVKALMCGVTDNPAATPATKTIDQARSNSMPHLSL